MSDPFQQREKSSFRKVFAIVVVAHLAVAALPIAWVQFGHVPAISEGKSGIRLEEVRWVDPALLQVNHPPAEPAAEPPPSPKIEEASVPVIAEEESSEIVKTVPVQKSREIRTPAKKVNRVRYDRVKSVVSEKPRQLVQNEEVDEESTPIESPQSDISAPTTEVGNPGFEADSENQAAIADAISEYHARIQKKMEQHWLQPRHVGTDAAPVAKVAITVSRTGNVSGVHLAASSGLDMVDRSALDAARAVTQIDPLPSVIHDDNYQVIIRFVLH